MDSTFHCFFFVLFLNWWLNLFGSLQSLFHAQIIIPLTYMTPSRWLNCPFATNVSIFWNIYKSQTHSTVMNTVCLPRLTTAEHFALFLPFLSFQELNHLKLVANSINLYLWVLDHLSPKNRHFLIWLQFHCHIQEIYQ